MHESVDVPIVPSSSSPDHQTAAESSRARFCFESSGLLACRLTPLAPMGLIRGHWSKGDNLRCGGRSEKTLSRSLSSELEASARSAAAFLDDRRVVRPVVGGVTGATIRFFAGVLGVGFTGSSAWSSISVGASSSSCFGGAAVAGNSSLGLIEPRWELAEASASGNAR